MACSVLKFHNVFDFMDEYNSLFLNSLTPGGSFLLKINYFSSNLKLHWLESCELTQNIPVERTYLEVYCCFTLFSVVFMVSFFILLNPLLVKPMHCKKG